MAPRDGSNVYHRPSGIDAVTNTTISSSAYNLNVQDVESDLNLPRPIVAGGTGANNAASALTNLGGEQAKQVVTNYSSAVFQPGSFYSASTATGAPVPGDAFMGICYVTDANNMTIEARDATTGTKYVRQMTAGIWGSWVQDPTTSYVDTSIANKAVRYDTAQTLTTDSGVTLGQRSQARSNIYAAPFDAMGWSGMQVNGSMDVSQELGTTGRTTSGYVMDGWQFYKAGTSALTVQQYATTLFPGFSNILTSTMATAQPSLGASDQVVVYHAIEGYRVARLAWGTASAQPITIGFWTAHNRVGIYSGSVQNNAGNRSYPFTYTQNTTNAPEYKTITIPGDTTGTWAADNTRGIVIYFALALGSSLMGAPNTWQAGAFNGATGQVNAVAATTDVFRLSGVVVLPGIEAPSAARSPLIMRPYDQELLTCKRYLWRRVFVLGEYAMTCQANGTTQALGGTFVFPVEMRAYPTATLTATGFNAMNAGGGQAGFTSLVLTTSTTSAWISSSAASGLVAGNATNILANGNGAFFQFDARL